MLVSKMLANVSPTSVDYMDAVKDAKRGDFVYFDPPYYPLSPTSNFKPYTPHVFSAVDQIKLRDLFVELDQRGCYVMLSNSATEFVRDLYSGYRQETVLAPRRINPNRSGKGEIAELVILNYVSRWS
jgi:DNA adenine methylase